MKFPTFLTIDKFLSDGGEIVIKPVPHNRDVQIVFFHHKYFAPPISTTRVEAFATKQSTSDAIAEAFYGAMKAVSTYNETGEGVRIESDTSYGGMDDRHV